MCVVHHQELLPLPHNVEPGYDTTVGSSEGVNTIVDQHIEERATTQLRMIHHLLPKF